MSNKDCCLVITHNKDQMQSLSTILVKNNVESIRLKAETKKYGLYLSRGKGGNAIIAPQIVDKLISSIKDLSIQPYTAQQFKESHQLKNIFVHRCEKIPKHLSYQKQLATKQWKDFRKLVLSQRGKKCEMCGSKENIQIHHTHYITGRKAWEYMPTDVLVLCKDCHGKIHGK